jgi:hypothetical protein
MFTNFISKNFGFGKVVQKSNCWGWLVDCNVSKVRFAQQVVLLHIVAVVHSSCSPV